MEAGNILSADVLDIIFEDRNKEYGAYDLRKHYQQRLMKALGATSLLVVLVCGTYVLLGSMKAHTPGQIVGPVLELSAVEPPAKPIEPTPPPPKVVEPPKIKMVDYMKPVIAPDEDVEKPMAEQDDIADAKIGNADTDGKLDEGIQAPVEEAKGVVEPPKKQDAAETIFTTVEIESQYPGGLAAWGTFLNRKMDYPQAAIDNGIQGTVMVMFIVDTEGAVSHVEALSGPEELRAAAVAAIKQSGKWTPAIQNGNKVKSYKRQPITFRLPAE